MQTLLQLKEIDMLMHWITHLWYSYFITDLHWMHYENVWSMIISRKFAIIRSLLFSDGIKRTDKVIKTVTQLSFIQGQTNLSCWMEFRDITKNSGRSQGILYSPL